MTAQSCAARVRHLLTGNYEKNNKWLAVLGKKENKKACP